MQTAPFTVDFIGIGSGKCGSTWIYENIVKHPEISDVNLKELNYFSDLYPEHDFSWYQSQFGTKDDGLIKGEFSVTYLAHPEAPKRIKKHFPNAKLIAIVRNPVKRAFSNYLHSIRKGDISPSLSFSDYIKDEDNLAPGRYHEYLKNFYDVFPKEQILVIVLEEFLRDIPTGMRQIYQHIGVKDIDYLPEGYNIPSNEAKNYRFLLLENVLVQSYRWLSRRGYTRFVKWVVDSGIAKVLRRFNDSQQRPPSIDDVSKQKLATYFEYHNQEFEKLVGRNTKVWS
ncbi:sulfotransferase [Alteromonas aestuariivivens]|uniref:Sulfotransferase n=1 Tax=Alteromonas aestuariivivens TaxID=1938339 RepID=A0A3D8MBU3_9ALTE|nr:sulfotransferase [Alteromonas aestuariivivens]RDV27496.1 sulfotransferase [Alteromonas aestuariivivens]